jgi:hypothetical protein
MALPKSSGFDGQPQGWVAAADARIESPSGGDAAAHLSREDAGGPTPIPLRVLYCAWRI